MNEMKMTSIQSVTLMLLLLIQIAHTSKLSWKTRPQETQLAKENDHVKLNCEFKSNDESPLSSYFVIWYKDGASQNVLSLNDQLANLNATNYEISGKYNLIIKNVTKNDSGIYTCQLFQSSDMIASVNLTVLVPPKYAKLNLKYNDENSKSKTYLVENDKIKLECCTNNDANPAPLFKWHKLSRNNLKSENINTNAILLQQNRLENTNYLKGKHMCNYLSLNLTRMDNEFIYKCSVSNEALTSGVFLEDSIKLSIEYKPETLVHLIGQPSIINKLTLVENSTITLYCNATARPHVIIYEWFFNDILLKEARGETLTLTSLRKNQAGNYACKSSNKHGYSKSFFNIELLYARVIAANQTEMYEAESRNLRQTNAIFLSSYENASVTLTCEIDSNPLVENGHWYYYQISKENKVVNKVMLSNWISNMNVILNKTEKRYYTQLNLNNITLNHSGYYSCAINFVLSDNLNQTFFVNSSATYYLQVKYTPVVNAVKKQVYANQYDQVELACDVKSNPQSIISWFYKNKELPNSYKYNMTNQIYKQINRTHLDDIDNLHSYRSTLIVKSVAQFDYGDYYCRANNIMGGNGQMIQIRSKQKPDTPIDFKLVQVTSNGVQLSWLSASNGGENSTFVITINQTMNFTLFKENTHLLDNENRFHLIEIGGLQPVQMYDFKLNAFNSLGSSDFTNTIRVQTLKTTLRNKKIPILQNAQFNEIREAICFDLEPSNDFVFGKYYFGNEKLNDLFVKIEVNINDALLNAANQELERLNMTLKQRAATATTVLKEINLKTKTYLINLSKLKYGQNCVQYSKLIQLDAQLRNSSRQLSYYLNAAASTDPRKKSFILNSSLGMAQSSQSYLSPVMPTSAFPTSKSSQEILDAKNSLSSSSFGRNFYEFKKLHTVNISLCYKNDSNVCAEKTTVYDFNSDFSTYITLIAIGCSAIFIFIILLIASLCCCCCRRKSSPTSKSSTKKTDTNSKLVISSFPIISTQQKFDYGDGSTKSSQQHILNGSHESHSSSSSASTHSGESYMRNEKIYYKNTNNNLIDPSSIFDSNPQSRYGNANFKIDYSKNSPSVATLESDATSSTSLENKTVTTSNGGKSSNGNSPYTVMAENNHNSYFVTMTSPSTYSAPKTASTLNLNQQQQQTSTCQQYVPTSRQPTLVYNGTNSMYIKTFQHPSYQQATNITTIASQQQIKSNSPESGYSTPNSNITKKLVYEVIV